MFTRDLDTNRFVIDDDDDEYEARRLAMFIDKVSRYFLYVFAVLYNNVDIVSK